jgi:type VI protein secretion system component VasK
MLQRYIDDLKHSTGVSMRMASLIALAGLAGTVALGFACAAIFIAMLRQYGAIEACLAIAGVFTVVAVMFALIYAQKQRRARERAAAAARAAARAAASAPKIDPMMIATGIQVARAVGLKKLIPLLAVAGVAIGYFVSRGSNSGEDAGDDEDSSDDAAGD